MSEKGKVIGIGGIFFKSPNKQQSKEWYGKHLGLADSGERRACGWYCGDSGEASLGAAAVLFQVPGHQRLDDGPVVGVEMAHGDQVLGQGPALVERPGLEGSDWPCLVNQAILQSEQTEE